MDATPGVALSVVGIGVDELDVDPVKTPSGPKVIPLPAAEDEDRVSTAAAAALLEEGAVGRTMTGGTSPVEATEATELAAVVSGSKRLSTMSGGVEVVTAAFDVVAAAPTVVVLEITTVITPVPLVDVDCDGSRRLAKRSPVVPALSLEGEDESLANISDNERFVVEDESTSCDVSFEVSFAGGFVIVEFENCRLIARGK